MSSGKPWSPRRRYFVVSVCISAVLILGLAALTAWSLYLIWLLALTVSTGLLFAFDKMRSRGSEGRAPENVLFALMLAGGVAGAWFGMLVLRHKRRKISFWVIALISTALHALLIIEVYFLSTSSMLR